jgi:hypothetical protein
MTKSQRKRKREERARAREAAAALRSKGAGRFFAEAVMAETPMSEAKHLFGKPEKRPKGGEACRA